MELELVRPGHMSEFHKSYFDKDRLRVDINPQHAVIFRQDKSALWILDREKKSYMEITEAFLNTVSQKMAQAQGIMMKRMENMPPEQRKAMQKIMGNKLPFFPQQKTVKPTFNKVATAVACSQWTCDQYEEKRGNEKKRDVWVATSSALGIDDTVYQSMRAFAGFTAKLTDKALTAMGETPVTMIMDLGGFPVKQTSYQGDGQVKMESQLKSIKTVSLTADTFELPAGYAKRSMPQLK